MLGLFATLVFALAGCASAAIIAIECHRARPALRRLRRDQRTLVADRVYIYALIDTPRPATAFAPQPAPAIAMCGAIIEPVRRRRQALAVPMRAAA